MPRNATGLSPEQRAAIVEEAAMVSADGTGMMTFRTAVLDAAGRSVLPSSPASRHARPDAAERLITCGEGDGSEVAMLPGCPCSWCGTVRAVALSEFGVLVTW